MAVQLLAANKPKSRYVLDGEADDHFRLATDFLAKFHGKKPNFGFNGLGEFVFYRTYSRTMADGRKETFADTLKRVVEGCYEIQRRHCVKIHVPWDYSKAQASAQEMFQLMWEFKFLPPGRGLWMMGTEFMWTRGSAALNNCFRGDTEIITRDGIKPIGTLAGTTQTLLTENGKWVEAPIKSFGQQEVWKLTVERSGVEKTIYTTAGHRWMARDRRYVECAESQTAESVAAIGTTATVRKKRSSAYQDVLTRDLKPNHCLRYVFGQGIQGNVRPSPFGVAHGIAFGDGTTGADAESCGTYLYLCGQKNAELLEYFPNCPATPDPSKGSEGAIRVADLPRFFRRVPSLRESKSYLYGWLSGYFAADGKINAAGNSPIITSSKRENIEFVRDVCAVLGIGTYSITSGWQTVKHADGRVTKHLSHSIGLMTTHLEPEFFLLEEHRRRFESWSSPRGQRVVYHWKVKSVEATGEMAEVFCPQVPETHSFALADNILTGNCGFVSTVDIGADPSEAFCFLMDMSMLGVGVGFDTKGAGKLLIQDPGPGSTVFVVPDSREGWVQALRLLINSYTIAAGNGSVEYDVSGVRPAESVIHGFGGKSSGPGILVQLLASVRQLLDSRVGQTLSSVDITDVMNLIGKCIVAGNVRRTAEIAFGEADDQDYCEMKNPTASLLPEDMDVWNSVTSRLFAEKRTVAAIYDFLPPNAEVPGTDTPIPEDRLLPAIHTWNQLQSHRWASNNSIFAKVGMNYDKVAQSIAVNGEPGLIWLNTIQDYGRMMDGLQPGIDGGAMGSNPCFSGNTRLFTGDGYRTLNDLWFNAGQHKYNQNPGRPLEYRYLADPNNRDSGMQDVVNGRGVVKATNVYYTGDSELFRVTLSDGSSVEATANHNFIVTRRRRRRSGDSRIVSYTEERIQLKDLEVGDMIPTSSVAHFGKHNDEAFGLTAGWCIGDGSLSPKADGQVRAQLNCYESDVDDVLPVLQEKLFDLYAAHNGSSGQNPKYAGWERVQEHFEHREEIIGSNILGRMLRENGVISGDKHRVPTVIWNSDKPTVAAFLRGLFSADGYANVTKDSLSIRLWSKSRSLLLECRLLLSQFGIASTVCKRRDAGKQLMNDGRGGKKLYDRSGGWELIVSGIKQCRSFLDEIGFIQGWKSTIAESWLSVHHGSNNSDTGRYTRVESIESIGVGRTYCLTEPGDNEVVVEGHRVGQCVEQSLESYELCCLVETFPSHHESAEDYMRTLKFAYLYAKTTTLLPTHNPRTNSVMQRNRRIGLSQSGIVQAFVQFGRRRVLNDFCDRGYREVRRWDDIYSKWLCVTKSLKVTSVKPSGTVSLVAGVTPGIHYPEASTYWRRVRVAMGSTLLKVLSKAGYEMEPDIKEPTRTMVVKFGVDDPRVPSVDKVSMWEQMANAVAYQNYWADNQVSCTIKFKPEDSGQIRNVLEAFEDGLKGISFLPWYGHGYAQAPYEPCTSEEVTAYNAKIKDLDFTAFLIEDALGTTGCDGDTCSTL